MIPYARDAQGHTRFLIGEDSWSETWSGFARGIDDEVAAAAAFHDETRRVFDDAAYASVTHVDGGALFVELGVIDARIGQAFALASPGVGRGRGVSDIAWASATDVFTRALTTECRAAIGAFMRGGG